MPKRFLLSAVCVLIVLQAGCFAPGAWRFYRVSERRPELAGLGKIAFVTDEHLWVVDPEGGQSLSLGPLDSISFAWSPDSRQLAVVRNHRIWIVNVDGSGETLVTPEADSYGSLDWSPDGTRIAYSLGSSNERDVYLLFLDGSPIQHLGHAQRLQWLSDGTFILYDEGWRSTKLSESISLDGAKQLFVASDWVGGKEVWSVHVANRDGSDRKLAIGEGRAPKWSPDGRTIVATRMLRNIDAHRRIPPLFQYYAVNADGSNLRALAKEQAWELWSWSPDSRWIAYLHAVDDGYVAIEAMNVDSGKSIGVAGPIKGQLAGLKWSPTR